MRAVTVGYKCHSSWHLESGGQWLAIGWAPWRGLGGGGATSPPSNASLELGLHPCAALGGPPIFRAQPERLPGPEFKTPKAPKKFNAWGRGAGTEEPLFRPPTCESYKGRPHIGGQVPISVALTVPEPNRLMGPCWPMCTSWIVLRAPLQAARLFLYIRNDNKIQEDSFYTVILPMPRISTCIPCLCHRIQADIHGLGHNP